MRLSKPLTAAIASAFLVVAWLTDAGAASSSEAILTVSTSGPSANSVDLDLTAIEHMPKHHVVTSTPWTNGVSTFDGVLLRDLLHQLGFAGSTVRFTALNDYAIDIPTADFEQYDVLLAYATDGRPMSVRDKGPLWVIYPLDEHPEINTSETLSKMIWQVRRMDLE